VNGRLGRPAVMITLLASFVLAGAIGLIALSRDRTADMRPLRPVPLGAYLGPGQSGVDAIAGFESWLGVPVTVGRAYLPGHRWADLEGPDEVLDPWSAWRSASPDRMLVLNVPMVAPNEPALGDAEVATLLRDGADGKYDEYFRALASRLVDRGLGDTVVVLGWEMNGTSYSSRCGPNPLAWKQYWERIVSTMRGVPGQRLRFDFAPVRGSQAVSWPACYPGDGVVDIIGMDSYDLEPGENFTDYVHQPYGLQAQASFAEARGKPMSYPEWGLFARGDNEGYLRAMHQWISTHNVAYQSITDYCPHGVWRCSENAASREAYRQLFGATASRSPPGR